jgi:hypothetical protein
VDPPSAIFRTRFAHTPSDVPKRSAAEREKVVPVAPLRSEREGKTDRFTAPVATGKLIACAVLHALDSSPRGHDEGSGTALRSWSVPPENPMVDVRPLERGPREPPAGPPTLSDWLSRKRRCDAPSTEA